MLRQARSSRSEAPREDALPTLLIEPDGLYREALLLAAGASLPTVRLQAVNDEERTSGYLSESSFSVVAMHLPLAEGLHAFERMRRVNAEVRVVVYGVADDDRMILAWAEAGVWACVSQSGGLDELGTALEAAQRGERWCSSRVAAALFRRVAMASHSREAFSASETMFGPAHLSHREMEVLRLVQLELTNKEIAARLKLQVPTVKNHLHRIFRKIGVRTRGEAQRWMDRYESYQLSVEPNGPSPVNQGGTRPGTSASFLDAAQPTSEN